MFDPCRGVFGHKVLLRPVRGGDLPEVHQGPPALKASLVGAELPEPGSETQVLSPRSLGSPPSPPPPALLGFQGADVNHICCE